MFWQVRGKGPEVEDDGNRAKWGVTKFDAHGAAQRRSGDE